MRLIDYAAAVVTRRDNIAYTARRNKFLQMGVVTMALVGRRADDQVAPMSQPTQKAPTTGTLVAHNR
jgi:hypothetical protein